MILQRDKRLQNLFQDTSYHDYGCYETSILFLVNKILNEPLDPDTIYSLHKEFVRAGWVQHDGTYKCYIKDAPAIFGHFGLNATQVFVAGSHRIPASRVCGDNEYEILLFKQPGYYGHFVVGDGRGHVAFDPWGESNSVESGTLLNKRVFRITQA